MRNVLAAAIVSGVVVLALAGHLSAATKTIEKPMFNGNRLDWCANWGADCGQPAADAFCWSQGFAGAAEFVKESHIGSKWPTRLIATGAICDADQCDGFEEITCIKQPTVVPKPAEEAKAPDAPVAPAGGETPAPAKAGAPLVEVKAEASPTPVPEGKPVEAAAAPAADATVTRSVAVAEKKGGEPAVAKLEPVAAKVAVASAAEPIRLVKTPEIKAFQVPVFNGRRLDWCRGWKDSCGKATADDFCKLNGYIAAASFTPDPHIGDTQPTRQIASGMVCDQDKCDGFKVIVCTE